MLDYHPLANLFELIEGVEFSELVEDIRQQGLLEPIVLLDGAILDGRNRYRACVEAGIDPHFQAYGDRDIYDDFEFELIHMGSLDNPAAYVVSRNIKRRHLNTSQRAAAAAKLKAYYADLAKDRQQASPGRPKKGVENLPHLFSATTDAGFDDFTPSEPEPKKPSSTGKARDQAGRDMHVSGKSVDMAEKVFNQGIPELQKKMESGNIAVSRAAEIASLPKEKQAAALSEPKPKSSKPKSSELQKVKNQLADAKQLISDQQETIKELTDELQSHVDLTADERQLKIKLNGLRERIRTLESQRDEYMMQVTDYKREIKALRRRLGDE